ncbi:putative ABC transporter permease protein [Alteripontixanthobacter maritimus]|uniref:Putative ABC transporter permease protein n=1 Tax=Alteripontixanthobacter maritimus TaxID=2161824 RepID=A0A369Q431_9SPHN|nr:ABC transporter permease [Alteripontixanthobacter maritimus]RDC59262.1 putative ABC transporter permease protein [Alteripontixanthobacter maritimus]
MAGAASFTVVEDGEGGSAVHLSGPYLVSTIGAVDHDLRELDHGSGGGISRVDLSKITEIDTVGAWAASRLASEHDAAIVGANERADRLLHAVGQSENDADLRPDRPMVFTRVAHTTGEIMADFRVGLRQIVGFLGQLLLATLSIIRHPRRFRVKAFVRQMELVGVSALPIVGLMSFLIGIVIAQQGATQLAAFGAETLTVNLVGRITLRELGVLMTAIMVAGRSGSAFAAQIGTMKLTEEVDAMRTIGISPTEALIIPRIMASVLMMPLLGFYAACMAIVGGAVVADLSLGIPFLNFLQRIQEVVPTYDLWVGLIKAPVFGLIVAIAGCYQGMQVEGDSEQVGARTTKAVVQAIFTVIVLDAFFAVFFTNVGWE